MLTRDLGGRPLAAPVPYPGSIERTSLAEVGEPKGFVVVHLTPGEDGGRVRWEFRPLPARPMVLEELAAAGLSDRALVSAIRAIVAAAPPDAVLRIRLRGVTGGSGALVPSQPHVRALAPETMNLEVVSDGGRRRERRSLRRRSTARRDAVGAPFQLEL